jgi:uncharacterized membrane protein (DUF2068 family)
VKRIGKASQYRRPSRIGFVGFEVIGAYKLISGLLALALGIWSLRVLDHDPQRGLERVSQQFGLDSHSHIIQSVISALTGVNRKHLRAIEAGAFAYAFLHLVEGIGLLRGRDWAGYLVIFATSSLIPFEVFQIARKLSLLRFGLLVLNVGIVIFLVATMRKERIQARASTKPHQEGENKVLL